MPKTSQALIKHWEDILESEGLGEVSLFDNTGKGHSVRFISTTNEGGNNDWFEHVNIAENGCVLRLEDTDTAKAARKFSVDVENLPPTWPSVDVKLLRLWEETGSLSCACKALSISWNDARKIQRRFEKFVKDSAL